MMYMTAHYRLRESSIIDSHMASHAQVDTAAYNIRNSRHDSFFVRNCQYRYCIGNIAVVKAILEVAPRNRELLTEQFVIHLKKS